MLCFTECLSDIKQAGLTGALGAGKTKVWTCWVAKKFSFPCQKFILHRNVYWTEQSWYALIMQMEACIITTHIRSSSASENPRKKRQGKEKGESLEQNNEIKDMREFHDYSPNHTLLMTF
jgi:hypothetical protein